MAITDLQALLPAHESVYLRFNMTPAYWIAVFVDPSTLAVSLWLVHATYVGH